MSEHDVLVIGAGPTGLACAIAAQRRGLSAVLVDKGCLTNSLFHYPAHMTFFTTPELLEIGDMPFSSPNQKPTRSEALEYYRKVAEYYKLDVRQYETVETVTGSDGAFVVHAEDKFGRKLTHKARKLIVSTGYYDLPNYLEIPGEDLPKVKHYYHEPHPYYAQDVVVIGGKNSAAIAALDLWRHGARVTLVHRGAELHRHIKYWIKPDIENRIKDGDVVAHFRTEVSEITEDAVTLLTPGGPKVIPNQFVFALTGYHPDFAFIEALGVKLDDASNELFWSDPFSEAGANITVKALPVTHDLRISAERAAESLMRNRAKAHLHPGTLDDMLLAAWHLDTLGLKIQFTSEISRFYWDAYQNQTDKVRVQNDLDEIIDINGRLESLRDSITETRKMYAEGWARENNPYWLDNVLVRYDNLASEAQAKIVAVQQAQRQYANTKNLPSPEQFGFFLK